MFIIAEVHGEICVQKLGLFLLQKKVIKKIWAAFRAHISF